MSTRIAGVTLTSSFDGINPQGTKVSATAIQPGTAGSLFDGNTAYSTGTAGGPVYSVPIWAGDKDTIGFQFSCPATGSPSGSYIIQGCNDPGNQGQGGNMGQVPDGSLANWSTLSFWDELTFAFVATKTVSGAVSLMSTLQIFSAKWFRFKWTNTSGSALITARAMFKGDGGR
jgi:hypothetical protein